MDPKCQHFCLFDSKIPLWVKWTHKSWKEAFKLSHFFWFTLWPISILCSCKTHNCSVSGVSKIYPHGRAWEQICICEDIIMDQVSQFGENQIFLLTSFRKLKIGKKEWDKIWQAYFWCVYFTKQMVERRKETKMPWGVVCIITWAVFVQNNFKNWKTSLISGQLVSAKLLPKKYEKKYCELLQNTSLYQGTQPMPLQVVPNNNSLSTAVTTDSGLSLNTSTQQNKSYIPLVLSVVLGTLAAIFLFTGLSVCYCR